MSSEGFGHPTGAYGGFGDNLLGFGDPLRVAGAAVVVPAHGIVPDDGGVLVTLVGLFPDSSYRATVGGEPAHSGVVGQGYDLLPQAGGRQLRFVQPPLPVGARDLTLASVGGSETVVAAFTVVRRHRASEVYALRRWLPPGLRAVGPRAPSDEELLS